MNWAREIASKVIEERPNEDVYTVASGISPSGFIHIGNFREFVTVHFVAHELKKLGKNVRFIHSFDDFDRYRKAPLNIDSSYSNYIGMPLSALPNPFGEGSYAEYFEQKFIDEMADLGIGAEWLSQAKEYKSGRYNQYIKLALDKRGEIFDILSNFKTQELTEDDKKNYYPISVYCTECGKDFTKVTRYDGTTNEIDYTCDCGHSGTLILDDTGNIKLAWKIDWPMRWMVERVIFEPGGKDHSAPNSSYASGSVLVRDIFGFEPPVYAPYNFIGIKGGGDKMSSSTGNVLTISDLLKVYDKYLILWFYAKYSPNTQFDISLDNDVIRYYSEFDRFVKAYYEGTLDEKNKEILSLIDVPEDYLNYPGFNNLATFLPMVSYDVEKLKSLLAKDGIDCESKYFYERLERAKYWVETYGVDYQIKLLEDKNEAYYVTLTDEEKNWVAKTIDIMDKEYNNSEDLQTELYAVCKNGILVDAELKNAQKRYFQILYNMLLGLDKGPKLGLFLSAISSDTIKKLLN